MKLILAAIAALLTISCSAQQQRTEQDVPQCLSLCSNQFAACTQEYPGDASACLPGRRDCEQACEAMKAEQRNEDDRNREPFVPAEPFVQPDAGTETD